MAKQDYCKYADVFYGNGEIDHFAEEGLSSKWFYIKALCGNTTPHAVLPFGKMSVGAYSGAYPTGYGTHYPNSCGGIGKISEKQMIRGFSHLHQSGTGAIGFYYNYAIVTPFYGNIKNINEFHENKNEKAYPGFYTTEFNDVNCSLTVNENTAYHLFKFGKQCGRVAIDFSNNGMIKKLGERYSSTIENASVKIAPSGEIVFEGILSGVKLFFSVKAEGKYVRAELYENTEETVRKELNIEDSSKSFGAVFDFDGDEILLKVSYSTVSENKALENTKNSIASFEETAKNAYDIWNSYLSRIEIKTEDEELKQKFYSNLYHSLIKPVDMTGEKLLEIKDSLVTDFATLWDQYKTSLPLILAIYPDMGEKITKALINTSKTIGRIPCSVVLANQFPCEEQAKMLGIITLLNAHHYGIKGATKEAVTECIERELSLDSNKSFIENGTYERFTHILDSADACYNVAEITDRPKEKEKLFNLASNWVKAYDENSGLMSENSIYYEGDHYTYSFRIHKYMPERIALAGGKEQFTKLLDEFFGFGKESLKQITHQGADKEIAATNYHRFQGFNNECDLEAPYAYIYADRHDRLCEIIHACVTDSFSLGKGGLPGNNDSGGLSACFVWNVLGIFPSTGNGDFLLGSPHIFNAEISLASGNKLTITAENLSDENYHVESVTFNGNPVKNFIIPAKDLMKGGKIEFKMK